MNSSKHHMIDQDVTHLWWAGMEALELLGIGWLVCDAAGRLLGANQIGDRILRARDGLHLNSGGVRCVTRRCNALLADAVRRASNASVTDEQEDYGAALLVRRAAGKRAFTLLVRPVRAMTTTDDCGQVALVLILDSFLSVQARDEDLVQLFGFTSAEARLANRLMDGLSLQDCCDRLEISRSTACKHLRHIFKKAGAHRQSELVSVLLKTIGLVRLEGERTTGKSHMSSGLFDQGVIRLRASQARRIDSCTRRWLTPGEPFDREKR
jgi:DNA-binding CsgD family transcriptional regulator